MASTAPTFPEIGHLVSLDHVNLRVPSQEPATAFFVEGLGLTRDPYRMSGTANMWVNIGEQQFHLPAAAPTPFPGQIGLVVPDLADVRERLARVEARLAETAFRWREHGVTLLVHDPWGRRFRLHQAGSIPTVMPLALAYVEFEVPKGTADAIGGFYEEVMQAPSVRGGGERSRRVTVTVGPHQSLRFVERDGKEPAPHNNHIALYLTGYREIYARMKQLGILMEKHRNEQFRFSSILNLKTGKPLFNFEHEMRSLYHGDYGRTLVNRFVSTRTGRVIGKNS